MANSRLAVAAHIVAVLAAKGEGVCVSSVWIAHSVNTNPVVIRRILARLTRAGIVGSEKGTKGGSKLLKCPDEVTLWDLSRALGEEHLFKIHRNPENPSCRLSCGMKDALGSVFAGAEKAAQGVLKTMTVKSLLDKAR